MFNELNPQSNNHQPIDDIFAETDKPATNPTNGIETHRVGLTTADSNVPIVSMDESAKSNVPWFKIIAIVIVAAILILSGYLVYSKFFSSSPAAVIETPVSQTSGSTVVPINTNASIPTTTTSNEQASTNPLYVPEIPGISTTSLQTSTPAVDSATLDTDNDSLTNAEEATYGTDPGSVDTDGDGLSDYEEIKIYHTNPLLADTDGDSYPDGDEVKKGYNPNGPGKLPGVSATSTIIK